MNATGKFVSPGCYDSIGSGICHHEPQGECVVAGSGYGDSDGPEKTPQHKHNKQQWMELPRWL